MSVIYISTAKTPTEYQSELIMHLEQAVLRANRAASAAKTNIDRKGFIYERAAFMQMLDLISQTTFDKDIPTPRQQQLMKEPSVPETA